MSEQSQTQTDAPAQAFNWDELLEPEASPVKASSVFAPRVSVLESIPAPIRQRAEISLAETAAGMHAYAAAGKNVKNYIPPWKIQPVPSQEQGKEFAKLLRKYGQYRPESGPENTPIPFLVPAIFDGKNITPLGQVTIRIGEPAWFERTTDGLIPAKKLTEAQLKKPAELIKKGYTLAVRYVVKPLETRKATTTLPGTNGS